MSPGSNSACPFDIEPCDQVFLHELGRTVDGHVVLLEEIGARIGEDSHPAHGGGDSGVRINEPSGMIHAGGVFAPSSLAAPRTSS